MTAENLDGGKREKREKTREELKKMTAPKEADHYAAHISLHAEVNDKETGRTRAGLADVTADELDQLGVRLPEREE